MKDILGRDVKVGDVVIMNDYNRPVFTILCYRTANGNMMGKWCATKHTQAIWPGTFRACTYIVSPYKPVVLVPVNCIPHELMEDYERIVNDPLFNKKK